VLKRVTSIFSQNLPMNRKISCHCDVHRNQQDFVVF
jgi:hypothetical protein